MEDRIPATYNMDSPSSQRSTNMTPEPSPTEPLNHHNQNLSDHPSESSKNTTHNPASSQQFCLRWNNHQVHYLQILQDFLITMLKSLIVKFLIRDAIRSHLLFSILSRVCTTVILTIINWARQPKLQLKLCCRCIPII